MIVKHPRMIIKQHEYFINYRYVGDVSNIRTAKPALILFDEWITAEIWRTQLVVESTSPWTQSLNLGST